MRWQAVRPNRPELYEQFIRNTRYETTANDREGGALNESRSAVIEDYRRSTIAIEATTASTRRSSTAYTSTVSDHQRIEAIHANFKQQAQRSSEDSAEISAVRARTVRANYLSNFFTRCTTELENTVADTFKRFSEELADREPGPQPNQARNTEFSASRDRATIEANGTTDEREVRLSEQLSRKISGFSTGNIFTALDQLDQRRELQREQERQRSRDYDSPSPF